MEEQRTAMYEQYAQQIGNQKLPWDMLKGKCILVAGASGLLGSALMELLLYLDQEKHLSMKFIVLARSREKLESCFASYADSHIIIRIPHDVKQPLYIRDRIDYIIQAAGSFHPAAFAAFPIDIMMTNLLGTRTLLDVASLNPGCRFLLFSSGEVYGQPNIEREIREDDSGYLNSNTLRAGYPESKRAAEALCQAYRLEKGVDFMTLRICRTYGWGMDPNGSMSITEFVRCTAQGKPIKLKSSGRQKYSFAHAFDVASAALYLLVKGEDGEAYNVGGETEDMTLLQVAELAGAVGNVPVILEDTQRAEQNQRDGYSKAEYAVLDTHKLCSLGWRSLVPLKKGLKETIAVMRENYAERDQYEEKRF